MAPYWKLAQGCAFDLMGFLNMDPVRVLFVGDNGNVRSLAALRC